ncbi:DUF2815 family protein [Aureibacillus halotolerans]|uniref:Uncharacterized protein DUF2815 n=1 Tax=Aureibacillus halotolerans TaxID=1508390 RepID=A0A4R6U820_9BACI|nr:DUF2815 family protein [Aureibacillus halotolerans]TDQ39204.1 uncharacterized protein DUF2815 [Aureibacillus halotolerans]
MKRDGTKVITGKVRASYVHIFEPKANEKGEEKYSISLIIPKSDTKMIKLIEDAIAQAAEEGKGKLGGKVPKSLKTPLRDGDVDRDDDEAYADSYFINATSKQAPGVVDQNKIKVTDSTVVYSGCFVRASVNFFAFNTEGNKGIAAGLNNIQKWEDGEFLGGRSSAEDDFDELETEEDDLL